MRERMKEKKTFSVTVAKSAVKLDAKRVGEASLTVTNTSDKLATGQENEGWGHRGARCQPRCLLSMRSIKDDQTASGSHTSFIRANADSGFQFCWITRYSPRNAVTRLLAAQ